MLIKFSSNAAGSFTMLGQVALALIKMMTNEARQEGALKGSDIDAALNRLRKRVQQPGATAAPTGLEAGNKADEEEDEEPVDLSARAFPLIEMLEAASAQASGDNRDVYVMWQPE